MSETVEELDGQGIVIPPERLDVIGLHNGFITLTNPAKGTHRTVQVYTVKSGPMKGRGLRRLALLSGPDNGSSYSDFGFVGQGAMAGKIVVYPRLRSSPGQKRGFYDLVGDMLANPVKWSNNRGAEYLVAGACRRCNRRLTVPASIDSGFGPECVKKGMEGV